MAQETNYTESYVYRSRKKRRKRRRLIIALLLYSLILLCGAGGLFLYYNSLYYKVCRVEAGVEVAPSDFLKKEDADACFIAADAFNTRIPGEYSVKIKTGMFTVTSKLFVQDTTTPELEVKDLTFSYGTVCSVNDFVVRLEDNTTTALYFETEPDLSKTGTQELSITAKDLGNNITTKKVQLSLIPVVSPIRVELGSGLPDVSEVLLEGVQNGAYIDASTSVDCNAVGEYTVAVRVDDRDYNVQVIVEDTLPPVLEVQSVTDYSILKKVPEDFVVSSEDISGVAIRFKSEPDFYLVGEQTVTIVAEDGHGNITEKDAILTLFADEDAPVFLAHDDFMIYLGETVSYKSKVTVTDNCETGLDLKVDATAVDLKTEGVYPVVYTATDAAGNSTTVTVNMTIKVYRADEEELYQRINTILADLITEDMTQREKCKKIYNYIRSVVSYVSTSDKSDWITAALDGLNKGKGDCFVYFALSKAMLTCADIPNLDIERIRVGDSMHFWNLVDLEDGHGWYHFDTTPRKDKTVIFLWDDAKLKAYSDKSNGSHNYDRALYPEIP